MLGSVISGFFLILRKPPLWLLALATTLLNAIVTVTLWPFFSDFLIDFAFQGVWPQTGFISLPFVLFATNSVAVSALTLVFLTNLAIGIWLLFTYSNYVKNAMNNKSIKKSIGFAFKNIGKIVTIILFVLVIGLFLALVMLALISLSLAIISFVGLALLVAYILFVTFLFAKFSFFIPISAIEDSSIKESLKKSWEFSNKHFWGIIALFLIVGALSYLIVSIGSALVEALLAENEFLSLALIAVIASFSIGFATITLPIYYIRETHGTNPFKK